MHITSNLTAAEDHTSRIGKTLPDVMCVIKMLGSELSVDNMKTWIQVVVGCIMVWMIFS